MLSPYDKLKSGVNDIIQIVVTTVCNLQCSNCTQLLPFRKDYKFMEVECFRQAVQSLKGWPGVIGLFGGNPCCHPNFEELCLILAQEIPEQHRRGLWSNDLLKHGELVRQVFYPNGRFNLNAHGIQKAGEVIEHHLPGKLIPRSDKIASLHAPILVDFRELNIRLDSFKKLREDCDINQKWSGAIVQRNGLPYAYFCEVAAAIDGILGTNRGILAIPGWWEKSMDRFEDQLACCNSGCAVPLRLSPERDKSEIYNISMNWAEEIEARQPVNVSSPNLDNKGKEVTDYMGFRR